MHAYDSCHEKGRHEEYVCWSRQVFGHSSLMIFSADRYRLFERIGHFVWKHFVALIRTTTLLFSLCRRPASRLASIFLD